MEAAPGALRWCLRVMASLAWQSRPTLSEAGVRNEELARVWEALDVFCDICNAYDESHHIPSDELKTLLSKTNVYSFIRLETYKAPVRTLLGRKERLKELLRPYKGLDPTREISF